MVITVVNYCIQYTLLYGVNERGKRSEAEIVAAPFVTTYSAKLNLIPVKQS